MKSELLTYLKFQLTKNVIIRGLAYPFMTIVYKRRTRNFIKTKDSLYLESLRGKYKGERCFIIGNGPSLIPSDLDKLKNEYTFAFNRIYYVFDKTDWRPTFYMSIDKSVIDQNESEIPFDQMGTVFLDTYAKLYFGEREDIHYINGDDRFFLKPWKPWKMYVEKELNKKFCAGGTVTFAAIQLAIYMGFSEIYLLGVDHNYSVKMNSKGKIIRDPSVVDYMKGLNSTALTTMCYDVTTHAFDVANTYCKQNNILIANCTRGGKLESFDRIPFDSLPF